MKRPRQQFSIAKSEKVTEAVATAKAMEAMKTFEGNLRTEHTEAHWVFKRVRD